MKSQRSTTNKNTTAFRPAVADRERVLAPERALEGVKDDLGMLWQATGRKATIREFASLLHQRFGVVRFTVAAVEGKDGALELARQDFKAPGVEPHSEGVLKALADTMKRTGFDARELADGFFHLNAGSQNVRIAGVVDPDHEGFILIWDDPSESAPEPFSAAREAAVEVYVRHVQNECRWHRTLDNAQSLLYKDDLTGLFNYRYLDVALDAELKRGDRFESSFCLLFIDLDGFKPVNDVHGHMAGSSVLRQVADVIRGTVRDVDIPIRYGGDEFVVILLGASAAKGTLAAERLRKRIEQTGFVLEDGGTARLSASIGVASYPEHGRTGSTLLSAADESMYVSKRSGKNRVTVGGGGSRSPATEERNIDER